MTPDDAIVRAGWLPCGQCREPAYASTAAWVGDEQIIATYEPTCPHPQPRTVLVDVTAMHHDPRCIATTRAGTRCRNRAHPSGGWGLCVNHTPDHPGAGGRPVRDRDQGGRDG